MMSGGVAETARPAARRGAIAIAGVTHIFAGSIPAVAGIDLDIEAGGFFTLLGPSGCGKTTLLRMIAGFEVPDAGRILISGREMQDKPTNFKNLIPTFRNPSYDPGNKYSIPYQWGTTGIVYDPSKIKDPAHSWSILFDPKVNPSYPFVLPKGEGYDQIGAACAYLGYGFACSEKSQWIAAAKLIIKTKKRPNFAGFVEETPARDQMKNGLIAVSMAFNGDIGQCYADGTCKKLVYFLPRKAPNAGRIPWRSRRTRPTRSWRLSSSTSSWTRKTARSFQTSTSTPHRTRRALPTVQGILKTEMFTPTAQDDKLLHFVNSLKGAQFKTFNGIWTSVLQ